MILVFTPNRLFMNINQARSNAIKQQIRPWGGLNYIANNALQAIPRELFVPDKYQQLVFADIDIPLAVKTKQGIEEVAHMFCPKIEGRILDILNIQSNETVLEIGTGSGYLTAVISKLCQTITSIEINQSLHNMAKNKINTLALDNINLIVGDASLGWQTNKFFDVVLVGASVPKITGRYFHLLNVGGRIFVVEGNDKIMTAKLITRISEVDWHTEILFETKLDMMLGLEIITPFKF